MNIKYSENEPFSQYFPAKPFVHLQIPLFGIHRPPLLQPRLHGEAKITTNLIVLYF